MKKSLTKHQSTHQTALLFLNLELTMKPLESMNISQNLNTPKEINMLQIQILNYDHHSNVKHSYTLLKLESKLFKLLRSTLFVDLKT